MPKWLIDLPGVSGLVLLQPSHYNYLLDVEFPILEAPPNLTP